MQTTMQELQVIHTSVGVDQHEYCWWMEAAPAANLASGYDSPGGVSPRHCGMHTVGGWKKPLLPI